jgi:hypothetical protein
MKDVDKLVQMAFGQLAELVDLDSAVERLRSLDGRDAQDIELGELMHELAGAASGAVNWAGQLSHAVRDGSGRLGGSARWVLPLGLGAAAVAAAKNRATIARSLQHAKDWAGGVPGDVHVPHHLTGLVDIRDDAGAKQRSTGAGRSGSRALREHLRIRAEHREQRRRFFSG